MHIEEKKYGLIRIGIGQNRPPQWIKIGDDIFVKFDFKRTGCSGLCIKAPKDIHIVRISDKEFEDLTEDI